jgi:hypothetical protein
LSDARIVQLTVSAGVVFPQSDDTNEYVPTGVEPDVLYPSHIVFVGFSRLEQAIYNSHLHGVTVVRNNTCVYAISSESPLIEYGSNVGSSAQNRQAVPDWYNVPGHDGSVDASHCGHPVSEPNPETV